MISQEERQGIREDVRSELKFRLGLLGQKPRKDLIYKEDDDRGIWGDDDE